MTQITEQIKNRLDVVDVVKEYLPELKKAGISWKARCPFHQEKTPSFTVSPEKQIWHCFGCGKGGDIFGFIKEIEGLEFVEALRILAKRAGVELKKQDPKLENERSRLLDILRLSATWYHQVLLRAKTANIARDYVEKRKINTETAALWQMGFAPDAWDGLLNYLQSRGYRQNEISKAGLIASNDRGGYYDRFRNRLMFPISDAHGSVVGFTARKLKEDDFGGKYINTPETQIYHKSEVLYGLSLAKDEIRKQDLAVVVEGNMDCVSSHQAGVKNVVASSGTALTPEQIRLLKRYTKNIALAFDPDDAGQEALIRGLRSAWQEDMQISIVSLPKGQDPDDLIKSNIEEWKQITKQGRNFMDWLFDKTEKENNLKTAEGKKQTAKVLLPWVGNLPNAVEQIHYLQLLSAKINVEENILRQLIKKENNHSPGPDKTTPSLGRNIWDKIVIKLLALLSLLQEDKHKAFLRSFNHKWPQNYINPDLYKIFKIFYDTDTIKDINQELQELADDSLHQAREIVLLSDELGSQFSQDEIYSEIINLGERLRKNFLSNELKNIRQNIKMAELSGDKQILQKAVSRWQELNSELRANFIF